MILTRMIKIRIYCFGPSTTTTKAQEGPGFEIKTVSNANLKTKKRRFRTDRSMMISSGIRELFETLVERTRRVGLNNERENSKNYEATRWKEEEKLPGWQTTSSTRRV